MKGLVAFIVTFIILCAGSCCRYPQMAMPPDKVEGWKVSYSGTTRYIGELLLRINEPTDNGKVGIKIVRFTEGRRACLLHDEPIEHTVTLQFYAPDTKEIICEKTVGTGNTFLRCDRVPVGVVGVKGINPKEGWVQLYLQG